jgi:hypothetical protein
MAEVIETTPEKVREIGRSMGLPPHIRKDDRFGKRAYISIIRRNWHLLPYDQLLRLLGWDADRLAFTLKEDDFLWHKLGYLKPACSPLRYSPPDLSARKRAGEIKELVSTHFGDRLTQPDEPRFSFIDDLSQIDINSTVPVVRDEDEPIRFIYSYFGVYGDPLLNPELEPYPDGLLQRLGELGVNGIWLHTVLRQLAPSKIYPEFGKDCDRRLNGLRKLVERADRFGIKIFLYINEPRAMPGDFFEDRQYMKGAEQDDHFAMCTSVPEVRQWITEALSYVFTNVPGLGGVFTITASENLTNCYSRDPHAGGCPRCSKRAAPEIIAEVNQAVVEGVRGGDPGAKVIAWDWAWQDGWAETIVNSLPADVYLMSVSERGKPITRGGISTQVSDYSISVVGPGPRAPKLWAIAKKYGLKTVAKIQVNCTWELSALPYLPVMNLVARHCANLAGSGIDGFMLSWTLGGYPSPNLQLVAKFQSQPPPSPELALREVAVERYGNRAAEPALEAWSRFSAAFEQYPFHISLLYDGPCQYGPANLLYAEPTGYKATMVGYPYDDLDSWRGVYPPEVLARQFEKVSEGWREGLEIFKRSVEKADGLRHRSNSVEDYRIAEAAGLHFKSIANQIRFIIARDRLLAGSMGPSEKGECIRQIREIATDEMRLARRHFSLIKEDSRIGFEASNQYYYFPLDLVEKVINCEYVLRRYTH